MIEKTQTRTAFVSYNFTRYHFFNFFPNLKMLVYVIPAKTTAEKNGTVTGTYEVKSEQRFL